MKRLILTTLCFFVIFSCSGCALSAEMDIKVILDGKMLVFDQNPVIQNDRVLVPLRKIFESMNAVVDWDPVRQTIIAVKDGTEIKLTVGSQEAYINNSLVTLDQSPVILNSRTLVPIRFVSEALGARVEWEAASKTVRIYSTNDVGSISCRDLGMISNDESSGSQNYKILIAAAKKGTRIYVDGVYYLKSSNDSNLVKNLHITGASRDTSKLILLGGAFFTLNGTAVVENVSIECPTNDASSLIRMAAPFINDITIRNNYITGNIRLVTSSTGDNYNFNTNTCYIENLVIDNNEFYDLYSSSSTKIMIYAGDTPVKSCFITNNKITNFSYIFYHNGITNGHKYDDYLYKNNNAVIKNNIVKCTDSYNAVARNNGKTHVYYCFSLIEGNSVECSGNTFEGFHLSGAPRTVVYDNYLSVIKLLYENNTWKNNVNFTAGIPEVDIMKSKTAYAAAAGKRERIYRGNTYIVEPGYADKFGKDRFLLRKEINTYTSEIDRITIEDNYFDMYILSFNYWGLKMCRESYVFNRNTVLMDTIEHSIIPQAMVYIPEVKDASGDYIQRSAVFTNNTITCDSKPFGKGLGDEKFHLIRNSAGCGDRTTVTFSNNNIKIPDYVFVPSSIEEARGCSTTVNFDNNIINNADL